LVQRTQRIQERLKKEREHLIQKRKDAENLRSTFGNLTFSNDQRDVAELGTARDELLQKLGQLPNPSEDPAVSSTQEWHSWILSMMGLTESKEQESPPDSMNDVSRADVRDRRKTASVSLISGEREFKLTWYIEKDNPSSRLIAQSSSYLFELSRTTRESKG
jgi:hypothetical protein